MTEYDPEKAMDVFDSREDIARPLTASDISDALGWGRRTALNKLNVLEAAGRLTSRDDIGGQSRVFWVPMPAHEHKGTSEGSFDASTTETAELDERVVSDGPTTVDELDLSDEHEDAIRAMRDLLREKETARRGDFIREVYEKQGHTALIEDKAHWWDTIGSGSKGTGDCLGDLSTVQQPHGRGKSRWVWVGGG